MFWAQPPNSAEAAIIILSLNLIIASPPCTRRGSEHFSESFGYAFSSECRSQERFSRVAPGCPMSAIGPKRTFARQLPRFAFDRKQTRRRHKVFLRRVADFLYAPPFIW